MAEVVQNANSEFWRAPVSQPSEAGSPVPALPDTCKQCSSEFVVGAGFCHVCGAQRSAPVLAVQGSWTSYLELARHLEFNRIKERVGLPTPALVAFLLGIACALAAVLVGFIFSANTVLDWQAVQVWRIQWLLGAAAAFLAGLVLKRN
ncbi:MAG TPA: hypothetical protein VF011_07180 [Terriglobales bacterium]